MQQAGANQFILEALHRILGTLITIHQSDVEVANSGYVIDLTVEIARLIDVLLLLGDTGPIFDTQKIAISLKPSTH